MSEGRPRGRRNADSSLVSRSRGARATSPFDDLLEACVILDADGRYVYLNRAAESFNGRPNSELLGRRLEECWPDLEACEFLAAVRRCREDRVPSQLESEFRLGAEPSRWFDVRIGPVPEGVLLLAIEVTERKRNELRVEHLNRMLQALLAVHHAIARERDLDRLSHAVCEALVSAGGYEAAWIALLDDEGEVAHVADAGLGAAFVDLTPRLRQGWRPTCWSRATTPGADAVVVSHAELCADCPANVLSPGGDVILAPMGQGETRLGLLGVYLPPEFSGADDHLELFRQVARDLAQALNAIENERRRSTYAEIVASSPDAMALVDRSYRYIESNASYRRFWSAPHEDLRGMPLESVQGKPFFEELVRPNVDRVFRGESYVYEMSREVPGLGLRHAEVRCAPSHASDGHVHAAAVSIRDITERKVAENRLRDSEARLSAIFRWNPIGIALSRLGDGVVAEVNPAFAALYGIQPEYLIGHTTTSSDCGLPRKSASRSEWSSSRGASSGTASSTPGAPTGRRACSR